MKRAMTILVCVLAAGLASAQNPQIIQNTKTKMDGVRNNAAAASNEALGITPPAAPARKGAPAIAKPSAVPAQMQAVPAASPAKAMPVALKNTATLKPSSATAGKQTAAKKTAVLAVQPVAALSKARATASQPATTANSSAPEATKSVDKQQGKKWSMTGKRDPFVSPVVTQSSGSGCSTGKKCLEIGAINLRGVVRSESGFIAVVTNSLNKAYFLRENDPVFDGYVVKITGDSIVFQETQHDHLGKAFTREVVKKITTPAV
jgi:Tfp pilus assembly protein PilP